MFAGKLDTDPPVNTTDVVVIAAIVVVVLAGIWGLICLGKVMGWIA